MTSASVQCDTAEDLPFVRGLDGGPLTVWRGESSGDLFDTFDLRKTNAKVGFFFAEDKKQADWYARCDTHARAFHLKAERILDLRDTFRPTDKAFMEFLRDYTDMFDEWVDRGSGEAVDPASLMEIGCLYDYEGGGDAGRWNALFRCAASHGYDAVVSYDTTDGSTEPVWVVFEPHQVVFVPSLELSPPTSSRCRFRS